MNISIKHIIALSVLLAGAFAQTATAVEAGETKWAVVGSGQMDVTLLRGDAPVFTLHTALCGSDWKGQGGHVNRKLAEVRNGKTRVYEQDKVGFYKGWWDKESMPGRVDLRYELSQVGKNTFRAHYRCTPELETYFGPPRPLGTPSVTIGPVLRAEPYFKGGACRIEFADGKVEDHPYPLPYGGYHRVKSVELRTADGELTRLAFNPPLFIHADHGELRCFAGSEKETIRKPGEVFEQEILLRTPEAAAFEPANRYADMSDWFPLNVDQAQDYVRPAELGMEDWLDKPAGKRGWLKIAGKDLVFEDGAKGKFWGINICGYLVAPEREKADRWAARCARYGVNLVRMHKILNHIGNGWALDDKNDSTKLNEERAVKFDYFSAALAKRGVYYGWSQFYAYLLSPADKNRVLAYDELMAKGDQWFKGSTIMLVCFAPDLQDLHIKALLNLLNRKNTVTGKRYADDKALAYIEIQNEDDIFFWGLDSQVKQCPTYYAMMKRQFSEWLHNKYGSEDAWEKAWTGKVREGESLVKGNVDPFAENMYDVAGRSRRVLDLYQYLYDAQTDYYKKVAKALRDAGYGGAICGSCWQTVNFLGHLYNVRSDREAGFIDRHNYGGLNMLTRPGGGLLSAGMQQVGDRPYSFSEWSGGGVYGGVESVPVIGFIGMGVQGWDISAQFASGDAAINVRKSGEVCDYFLTLCQSPAVARALYRADFIESEPVAVRRVSIPAMATGDVGFNEEFSLLGGANIKEFSAAIRQEALGVGPVTLEFVDGPVENPVEDRSAKFIDQAGKRLTSASGQVMWDYSGRGFFTMDTPGTQGVVGFGGGQRHAMKDVVIQATNPLSFIYVSARGPKETIADARSLLVTTVGRQELAGTILEEATLATVQHPKQEETELLVEPVVATIELRRKGVCRVYALDHGGRKTEPPVEVAVENTAEGCRFTLDGRATKTMFYLVEIQ